MKDPYLKLGVPCEVWNKKLPLTKQLWYFLKYNDIKPTFYEFSFYDESYGMPKGFPFDNYRVLNTEWDYAPDWAVCSTVCRNGSVIFWRNIEQAKFMHYCYLPNDNYNYFICPDKSRYEGDAWKTSLRMRPEWAGGKG